MRFDRSKCLRAGIRSIRLIALGTALALLAEPMPPADRDPFNLKAAELDANEVRCLALTLYWEARAEGRSAMEAVAWVVLNRRKNPNFPDTVCEVVRQGGESPPCQFSYWCDGEPETPQNEEAWERAREVAAGMLNKPPPDPTNGALFFHSVEIAPPWTKERKRTATIGRHIFYR
jgi:N-acetylmuramoyl-L-alanine amidase